VRRLGAVTGLSFEAKRLRRALRGAPISCAIRTTGGRSEAAQRAAHALLNAGATALLSFGFAAGLDPTLRPGAIVLCDVVVLPDGRRLPVDAAWADAVTQAAARLRVTVQRGAIVGSDHAVTTVAEKRWLHERTRALALDMESHAVAEVAKPRVPFLALRVVIDPAERAVPEAAAAALGAGGRVATGALVLWLLRRPAEIPGLVALARDAAAARPALGRAAALVAAAGVLG
jgi:hopanoid-associated phosphorylase